MSSAAAIQQNGPGQFGGDLQAAPGGAARLRITPPVAIMAGLLLLGFVALFHRWLLLQHLLCLERPADWAHAYAVPFVSLYLLWQLREEIARERVTVFWPGLALMVLGIVSYFFFIVGFTNHMAQGWCLVLTLTGALLLLLGPGVMRYALLPVAYLVFAITISDRVMTELTAQLQLIASRGAYVLLNILGITTDLAGVQLTVFPRKGDPIPLNVAEQCSGMRQLIAFLALGAAVALVACRAWWKRVVLIMLAPPVAILVNIVRVAVLGVLSIANPEWAQGEAHTFIGTLLLIPAFLVYMLIVWALNRAVPEPAPPAPPAPASDSRGGGTRRNAVSRPALAVALLVLFGAAGGISATISVMGLYLRKLPIQAEDGRAVHAIPVETESWIRVGADRIESDAMVTELGTRNYLNRRYVAKSAPEGRTDRPVLDLHLAYYTGMVDTVPHVPERCLVGGGALISSSAEILPLRLDRSTWVLDSAVPEALRGRIFTARLPSDPRYTDAPGSRVRLPRDPGDIRMRITGFSVPGARQQLYAGYFFIANGGVVPNAEEVRLLAFNLSDDYAYFLKVQVSTTDARDAQELADLSASLLNELLPEIMRCVPDWVRVQTGEYPPDNPRRRADAPPPI